MRPARSEDRLASVPRRAHCEYLLHSSFIFDTINSRLKYLLRKRDFISEKKKKRNIMNASYNTPWFTVLYLSKFADKFKEIIRGLDTRLSFYSLNKLGGIIKAHKDILPKLSNKDVVYKLCCKNCDASYVGQTSRQLKTRISEHRNTITSIGISPHSP